MSRGRKTDYTFTKLKEEVNRFASENLDVKITVPVLVKATGISKNTWYRCKEILDYINALNSNSNIQVQFGGHYPTASELYDRCKGDEKKTKAIFVQLLDIIECQNNQLENYQKATENISLEEINKLQETVKMKEAVIGKLNNRINELTMKDDRLLNIRDNLNKMRTKSFSEQFGYLLDD